MVDNDDVIDWDQAMEQCGEDEEFLRELLMDLKEELNNQIIMIDKCLDGKEEDPYFGIQRAAHVVKGASSNLMCEELRRTSFALEKAGSAAHEKKNDPTLEAKVKTVYLDFKEATRNFDALLKELDINEDD